MLGAVVRLTEPDMTMVECFDEERNTCRLAPRCVLKHVLRRATSAYLQELDRVSLASVLPVAPGVLPVAPVFVS